MRLDVELVARNLSESRQEAQLLIEKGAVRVDGDIILKRTKNVAKTSKIEVSERREFVSRGGEKLEGALIHIFGTKEGIKTKIEHMTAIDIGASTGGFTDCLLKYGVSSVYAVDIGTSQLHSKLRSNKSVTSLEQTDIRSYEPEIAFDIVVGDLSFISLESTLQKLLGFGKPGSSYFLLIKPQFEVGKGNTKKGIVRDQQLIDDVLNRYSNNSLLVKGATDLSIFPCTIKGGDGNQEYFLYFLLK